MNALKNDLKNKYYSWIICLAGALLVFCCAGLVYTGFSPYQPYLISVRGLTNFQCASLTSIRTFVGLFAMSAVSPLMERFGLRRVASFGMLCCTGAFLTFGLTTTYAGACAASVLAGISYGLGGMITASILISRWFNCHNGLALGIVMAATGLSAFIGSPIITRIITQVSLRAAFLAEAAFVLVSAVIVYAVLRSRPSCINLEPLGGINIAKDVHSHPEGSVYAPATAPRHMIFLMSFLIMLFGLPANNLTTNISLLYRSAGMDAAYVGWLISLFGMAVAAGKCIYGQISDRIGMIPSTIAMYLFVIVGSGLCCLAGNGNQVLALAACLMVGFGLAVTSVSASTYALHISTEKDYPAIVSRFQLLNAVGGLIFSPVPGIIADRVGSYIPGFILMFLIAAVSSAALLLTYTAIQRQYRAA